MPSETTDEHCKLLGDVALAELVVIETSLHRFSLSVKYGFDRQANHAPSGSEDSCASKVVALAAQAKQS